MAHLLQEGASCLESLEQHDQDGNQKQGGGNNPPFGGKTIGHRHPDSLVAERGEFAGPRQQGDYDQHDYRYGVPDTLGEYGAQDLLVGGFGRTDETAADKFAASGKEAVEHIADAVGVEYGARPLSGCHRLDQKPPAYSTQCQGGEVCREHQKSVLENVPFYGGGKKRYWVEKNGQLTHRDMLKRDIDEAIAHCYKESMFINYLESLGYEFVRSYNDYEHPSVKAPSWQRPIRIDKLGAEYTREAIAERLRSNLGKDNLVLSDFQPPDRRRKPLLIILQSYPRYKEPDGFTVFFQVIVDFFKWIAGIPQNDVRHYAPLSPEFRAIWKDLDKISEQTHFLCKHSIVDSNDFHRYEQQIDDIIVDLVEERQKLRNRIRRVKDPDEETALKEKCKEITKQIEPYRKEKRICEQIKKRQPELQKAVEQELQAELGVQPKNRQKQYERNSER